MDSNIAESLIEALIFCWMIMTLVCTIWWLILLLISTITTLNDYRCDEAILGWDCEEDDEGFVERDDEEFFCDLDVISLNTEWSLFQEKGRYW